MKDPDSSRRFSNTRGKNEMAPWTNSMSRSPSLSISSTSVESVAMSQKVPVVSVVLFW